MNSTNNSKKRAGGKITDPSSELKPILKQQKTNPNQRGKTTEQKPTKPAWHQNQQFLTKFISLKKQFSLGTGQTPTDSLVISSWNINGLRAITSRDDLQSYFKKRNPDILCLSETKTTQESIDAEKLASWIPAEYTAYWNCSKVKKGYSGTAIITRYKPLSVEFGIGLEKYDVEGRAITVEFETFSLVACYVPMSGDDFSKLQSRVNEWDSAFRAHIEKVKSKGKPLIVCGDLNVVSEEIDIWADMGKVAGTSNEERNNFKELLKNGFIDSFRHLYPDVRKYSWWSTYLSHRPVNKGRRYDYILVSGDGAKGIKDAFIDNDAYGSDHCPVELIYNPNFHEETSKKNPEKEQMGSEKTKASLNDIVENENEVHSILLNVSLSDKENINQE